MVSFPAQRISPKIYDGIFAEFQIAHQGLNMHNNVAAQPDFLEIA